MTYVFFGKTEAWKSDDLKELQEFVNRNFGVETYWMNFGIGEKVAFSECKGMSLERCPAHYKSLHLIPTIGETYIKVELQN